MKGVTSGNLRYVLTGYLGTGSFGSVYEAKDIGATKTVAIKKVLQDSRYKNRELEIMRRLHHPNIVELYDYYYVEDDTNTSGDRYLNLVMEFVPNNVHKTFKQTSSLQKKLNPPLSLIRILTWQLCRSVGYLHACGIGHRDIKPQNLLMDLSQKILKLCDFGSAKFLYPQEQSVSYICSRYYRAPELMLGATEYGCSIDTWSIGCVLGELLLGRPLFAGETTIDQMTQIVRILGPPSKKQIKAMSPLREDLKITGPQPKCLSHIFGDLASPAAVSLLEGFLRYHPLERIQPLEALGHPFFDEMLDPSFPEIAGLPLDTARHIWDFSELELQEMSIGTRTKVLKAISRTKSTQQAEAAAPAMESSSGLAAERF